ncbi:hypothetical protein Dsin_019575 [Dipteronia sinensis]|uniref:Uncharacterized protein n=1 Tax=Dipteronia sinensis TaxID=43782 RepID=A0AAE0E451_9ROSI|nr:hypothetical protein Dsin_019575 [Dipteronia sinensis]
MARNNFNARMLELIEEEEDDDYGILLGMAAIERERLAIESRGPRHGGSVPSHVVIDRDKIEGHVHEPTIIFKAVASYDLWIRHAFFGLPGSHNDINVLERSFYLVNSEKVVLLL